MKKVFGLLAAAAVLSSSVAFAQDKQDHEVNVKVPEVLRIRLTSGNSTAAVVTPDPVEFDFSLDGDGNTAFDVGSFGPTNANHNWDDVKVFSNADSWDVRISVTNTGDPVDADGFDWDQVSITADGANTYPVFTLSDDFAAGNNDKTSGWESLGFGPEDFKVTFDGSEDAGDYSATVVYTIVGGL